MVDGAMWEGDSLVVVVGSVGRISLEERDDDEAVDSEGDDDDNDDDNGEDGPNSSCKLSVTQCSPP